MATCQYVDRLLSDLERGAGRFVVACAGQFRNGKPTVLNALVNDRVLPADVWSGTPREHACRTSTRRR